MNEHISNQNIVFTHEIWKEAPEITNSLSLDKEKNTVFFLDRDNADLSLGNSQNEIVVYADTSFMQQSEYVYQIDSKREDDYQVLFRTITKAGKNIGNIVFMWHFNGQVLDKESMEFSIQHELFFVVKALYKTKIKMPSHLLLVGGEMQRNSLLNRSLEGITRSLHLLFPNTIVSYMNIDVETVKDENLKTALRNELSTTEENFYPVVSYQESHRMIQAFKEWNTNTQNESRMKKNATYVLTGGIGGIGIILANYLAKTYQAKLILMGRRTINQEIQEKLDELRTLGADACYYTCDIADEESVKTFVTTIEKENIKVNGIFHIAGIVSKDIIFKKELEAYRNNLCAKVAGTVYLDEMTSNWDLDFFVAFSSTSSVIGDFGQGDYAVANRFLELYMQEREIRKDKGERKGVSRAINWPLWESGGMHLKNKGEQLYLQSSGLCYLNNEDGLEALEKILAGEESRVSVFAGERDRILSMLKVVMNADDEAKEGSENKVESTSKMLVIEKLQQSIRSIAAEVLEAEQEKLDLDDNIGDFGFDSISLKDFADSMGETYGVEISPTVFFAKSTIRELSEFLLEEFEEQMEQYFQTKQEVEVKSTEKTEPVYQETKESMIEKKASVSSFIPLSQKYGSQPSVLKTRQVSKKAVAIVGMSFQLPGANTQEELWDVLISQKDCVDEIPRERWNWEKYYCTNNQEDNKTNSKWGGFIHDCDKFDARFFKISTREAELMDPQQRLYIQAVWKAVEDSGHKISEFAGKNVGVFAGIQFTDYQQLLSEHMDKVYPQSSIGNAPALLSNRISFLFDFMGPSESIDTACSSSLVAIHRAVKSIQRGESEMAIAGGVSLMLDPNTYVGAGVMGFFSPDGRCKTFDKTANGYVKGEGVGAIVLKPLEQAEADGDPIYGVILGSAENHGGHANSLTAPNPDAQAELIVKAYEDAEVDPTTVCMIETHGTGTELGDPIEIDGLIKAFKQLYEKWNYKDFATKRIGLGALKSNIGHLEPASGVAGVIKLLLCMKHKTMPGNVHFTELNPYIKLENSPFYVLEQAKDWNCSEDVNLSCGSVSSFGFGGTNAHVVVQEYKQKHSNVIIGHKRENRSQVLILSAKTKDALTQYAFDMSRYITGEMNLDEIAYTLQIGREEMKERLAIVATSCDEYVQKLNAFVSGVEEERIYVQTASEHMGTFTGKIGMEEEIAEAWTKGYVVDWKSCLVNGKVNRVSLPTYPFAQTSYWIPQVKKKKVAAFEKVHTLIDRNVSNLYEQRFETTFRGDEFFVADHRHVLPGVVYLEMARVAANCSLGNETVGKLKNIVWSNPIVVGDQGMTIYTGIQSSETNLTFQLYSEVNGKRVSHGQGIIEPKDKQDKEEYINVAEVMKRCKGSREEAISYYSLLAELGAELESRFKGIQEFYYNQKECISKIGVKAGEENTLDEYYLHPTLTDGGLQSSVAFAYKTGLADKEILYVPFILGEVELCVESGTPAYAYATQSAKGGLLFDILLLAQDGKVLAKMRELTIRPIQLDIAEQANRSAEKDKGTMLYLEEVWQDSTCISKERNLDSLNVKKIFVTGAREVLNMFDPDHICSNYVETSQIVECVKNENNAVVLYGLDPVIIDTKDAIQNTIYPFMEFAQSCIQKIKRKATCLCIYKGKKDDVIAEYEALDGFIKTLNMEQNKIIFRLLAMDSSVTIKGILETELSDGIDIFVKYEDGVRKIKKRKEILMKKDKHLNLRTNGTYVITGGMGGIGKKLTQYLAENYQANLVLCGRSSLGTEKLAEFKNFGGKVIYEQVDLTVREEVEHLYHVVNQIFGTVHGVFHCAGVVKDGVWAKKNLKEVLDVFAPKIYGTQNLYAVFSEKVSDFMMAFSSTTSVLGNMGQADYAYANGYLDCFVRNQDIRKEACKKVVNWSLWENGGMKVDQQTEQFLSTRFGMTPITDENGCNTIKQIVESTASQVIAMQGRKEKLIQQFVMKQAEHKVEKEGKAEVQLEVKYEDTNQVNQLLEGDLVRIICNILKAGEEEVRACENIVDLGFDSITFTELANEINKQFNLEVTPAIFFDYTNVTQIAGQIIMENADKMKCYYRAFLVTEEKELQMESTAQLKKEPAKTYRLAPINTTISHDNVIVQPQRANQKEPIAIIGLDGIMPGSDNVEEFWNNLLDKKDLITEIPEDRWDYKEIYGDAKQDPTKTDIIKGGFMKQIDQFDPLFFHISPVEAAKMDPQERIMLQTVWHTIEDAGYRKDDLSGTRTAVFIGVSNSDYQELMLKDQLPASMTKTMIPNRISYFFNWNGPSEPVDTACSSSLVAIHRAIHSIWEEQCDYAIAGGVNVITSPNLFIAGSSLGMLSKDGKCKTFDAEADGYVRGEGAGAILLKPLSKAIADKDNIYAVIRGSAVNHGGKSNSISAPNAAAQADVIVRAHEVANIDPSTISYIETHGTGTSLGDPIEIEGIKKAYSELHSRWNKDASERIQCVLGCVKTNIGHLEPASGMASILKVLMAMKFHKIPGNINFHSLNPYIKLKDTDIILPTDTVEWTVKYDENGREIPRRAGISSFGVGGSNAHIILEEYKSSWYNEEDEKIGKNIIVISAKTKDCVENYCRSLLAYINNNISENIERTVPLEEYLRRDLRILWEKVTHIPDIDWNEYFYEYGIDAVMLIDFMEQVKSVFKLNHDLPIGEVRNMKNIIEFILRHDKDVIETCYQDKHVYDNSIVKSNVTLTQLAYMLQMRRESMSERVAFVASSIKELREKLELFLDSRVSNNGIYVGSTSGKPSELYLLMKDSEGQAFIRTLLERRDMEKLARFWSEGLTIPWTMLYQEEPMKVSIPKYCFENEVYWLPSNREKKIDSEKVTTVIEAESVSIESSSSQSSKMILDDEDEIMELLNNLSSGKISSETVKVLVEDIII